MPFDLTKIQQPGFHNLDSGGPESHMFVLVQASSDAAI